MVQTIKTEDLNISYFRFGNENGVPFIIVPGISLKSVMESEQFIINQYRILADRFNVYVFDRSKLIHEGYRISDMADDLIKAMDILGIRGAVVYGVSQGGMIAQQLTVKRPDLVGRLILCSTAPYADANAERIIGEWISFAENNGVSGLMNSFAENVYSAGYCEKYRDAFVIYGKMLTDDELRRFILSARSLEGFDVREQLSGVKCPVLVIAGSDDRIFEPALSRDIAALTGAELVMYDGQAHSVYDEEPDVLRKINEFAGGSL